MSEPFAVEVDLDHRRCFVGDEPMIFHCHHYNAYLQRTIIEDAPLDTVDIVEGAAAEVAHTQLTRLFAEGQVTDLADRKRIASQLYRWAGFGLLDLTPLTPEGGSVNTSSSHYALGWNAKWSGAKKPVCHFAAGWLAGATAALFDRPLGAFTTEQTTCVACGDSRCGFSVAPALSLDEALSASPGRGTLTTHNPRPIPDNNVDYPGIMTAVAGLPLIGNEEGHIPAFGVYLTRHYANYYCRISYAFLDRLTQNFGDEGWAVAEPLLIEAGHICAFNTFGGIMTSTEWDALIRPTLQTREDWIHGILAVVNCLGWGRWQVTELSSEEATFVLHDDYESVAYNAMYGQAPRNISFLAQGGVAGLMNLVYHGDIASRPTLDERTYQKLFKQPNAYTAETLTSQAMGDDVTTFRVTRG